jgi:hypothetical protein
MSRRWTLRLVACALGASAVLTGCSSGNQEARETLPSPTSAAPSEEELPPLGPADMPMPAEARTQDAAGAEAFVRYYIELINRTSTVMDAQPLRDLSAGCRDCDRIADNVEVDAAAGYQYRGGELSVAFAGEPFLRPGTAELALEAEQAAASAVDATGADAPHLALPPFAGINGGAALKWDPDRQTWIMTALTLE